MMRGLNSYDSFYMYDFTIRDIHCGRSYPPLNDTWIDTLTMMTTSISSEALKNETMRLI